MLVLSDIALLVLFSCKHHGGACKAARVYSLFSGTAHMKALNQLLNNVPCESITNCHGDAWMIARKARTA